MFITKVILITLLTFITKITKITFITVIRKRRSNSLSLGYMSVFFWHWSKFWGWAVT